jgi:DNA-directed RNA polymerase subunit beta
MSTQTNGTGKGNGRVPRQNFSKIKTTLDIPNLIDVQHRSYERFLQMNLISEERASTGLQAVFNSIFPFSDFRETCSLDFVQYSIGAWQCKCSALKGLQYLRMTCSSCGEQVMTDHPHEETVTCQKCGVVNKNRVTRCDICGDPVDLQLKYSISECQERGMTYAVPLTVTFRLFVYDKDPETGTRMMRDAKEEEVYFGEIPLMTDNGTFVINGTERVIVSQLHRSPGVFFTKQGKQGAQGYLAKIIPYRGSWVELEYDHRDVLSVRIDRKRKLHCTIFLRALGLQTDEAILREFYATVPVEMKGKGKFGLTLTPEVLAQEKQRERRTVSRRDRYMIFAGIELKAAKIAKLEAGEDLKIGVGLEAMERAKLVADVVDLETGEVLLEANEPFPEDIEERLEGRQMSPVEVFFPDWDLGGNVISTTLAKDSTQDEKEALIEIYRRMRPGDPPTLESARSLFYGMFFDAKRYDFSRVGRFKFNIKLDTDVPVDQKTLSADDFYRVIRYLVRLHKESGRTDDIDNLGNRRVRAVGELLENQVRIGLVRMERAIKEKMSVHQDIDSAMPHDLINSKPVIAAIKEFFGSSQLSQFMDQTNPLSEVTHKRRLSALGPGGLSRERAGFEVRDVHASHYGRICPIETPEGPNIGLISSLATYARINAYGFIESPYQQAKDGKVLSHLGVSKVGDGPYVLGQVVEAAEIAATNRKLKREGKTQVSTEPHAFYLTAWEEEKYIIAQANSQIGDDGSFLEDRVIARAGGDFLAVERDRVDFIDISPKQLVSVAAALIPFLENDDANRALMGSNMQRQAVPLLRSEAPIVGTGLEGIVARDSGAVVLCKRGGVVDSVDAERVIVRVEGEDIETGDQKEFGADIYQLTKFRRSNQNTCITQVPLVSAGDRVKKGHVLADGPSTENGELALGRNVLVAFMPWRGYNFEDAVLVSENAVREDIFTSIHIEEFEVEARDTKLGPEEITRDIPNVSESALTDLDVKIFSRKGGEKDARAQEIEDEEVARLEKNAKDEIRILTEERNKKIRDSLAGLSATAAVKSGTGEALLKRGEKVTHAVLQECTRQEILRLPLKEKKVLKEVGDTYRKTDSHIEVIHKVNAERVELLQKGDELPPGVIKMVKVFVAMKRKLQVGDKMAGRHGNKGVLSRVLPAEDMPYLPDGTPVDIVLNPLGVPSRMNVGQILETHLGWAGKKLGMRYATPVFDGAREDDLRKYLKQAELPLSGKTTLCDGITGEEFEQKVTVGYIYMLKLSHLVDDKIHARSIGPYSLITQQPLGGKAQFGGQRFGEMEVWALEAYGAAYTLQELLTVKSDDVEGRSKAYEAIVKGDVPEEPGLPESFNVLVRELQSLCLDIELIKTEPDPDSEVA